MQSLPLFIVESQTAKRRLLKIFELPDDCRSHLERNGWAQGSEERPISPPRRLQRAFFLPSTYKLRNYLFRKSGINRVLLQ